MPRQRKPQNGGQRLWTWRVANTTTSSNLQTVYRIPTWNRKDCDVRNFEITWTSPVQVRIEWENVYNISLDTTALQAAIENMDLDLSNVTLETVNGNVTFTWNVTTDGTFTWTTITANTVNATTGNITTVNSTNIYSSDVSTATLETTWNTAIWWNLDVDWDFSVDWTSTLTWDVSAWWDLTVTWVTTTSDLEATTWGIETLTSNTSTIWTLTVTNTETVEWSLTVEWTSTLATTNATDVRASWTLAVTWASTFVWDVTTNNISSNGTANLNDTVIWWNETIAWTLAVTWATTLNNTLTVAWASTLSGTTSVGWNLSVAWNEAVSWTSTVSWNAIFSQNVSIAWDETLVWDLTVDWETHLKNNVDIDSNLNVDWTTHMLGSANVDHVLTIGETLALWANATAPQFILQAEKNQPNGVAALNASGKIDDSVLPPLAIWETFVVSSEAQMLALTAQTGDRAIRTDESKTYIKLNNTNPSSLSDWQVILSSWEVISVNWQTWAVVLDADDISDLATTNKFVTAADKANWNAKEDVSNKDTATLVDSTTHYPSSHVMVDQLATKQETLVNQQNIKSINNQSLLGSGNITITANVDFYYEQTTQWATTYTLQHTPISNNSVMVFSDSWTALFPMIDYTLNNWVITFVSLWATESAIIWIAAQVS